jgi:hypothetical protein
VGPTVFEDGHLRLVAADTDGLYGSRPHTVQPTADCGAAAAAGQFVQIPASYLRRLDFSSVAGRQVAGQQFVHEWAKFRYGVFDELGYPGDRLFPAFYFRTAERSIGLTDNATTVHLQPNFCTNTDQIDYRMEDSTGRGVCRYDKETGLPDGNCLAVAATAGNSEATQPKSSVMALPYVMGSGHFCDGTPTYPHDSLLPNKQNLFCNGRSAFEIIRQHADFAGFEPGQVIANRAIHFQRVVAATTPNYVVLMDRALSMAGPWLHQLQNALRRWILYEIGIDQAVNVGLATFCSNYTVVRTPSPVTVDNRAELLDMVASLNLDCHQANYSSLAVGLQAALDSLNSSSTGGGIVILVSSRVSHQEADDGQPVPGEEQLRQQGVRIVSVLLGARANPQLLDLASRTGGQGFYVQDHTSTDMAAAFWQALAAYTPPALSSEAAVILARETGTDLPAGKEHAFNITVDSSAGRDVVVQLDYSNSAPSANLSVFFLNQSFTTEANASGLFHQSFPNAPVGIHQLVIQSSERLPSVSLLVSSKPAQRPAPMPPLTVECWTSHAGGRVAISSRKEDWIAVYARVERGGQPVLGAEVMAQVGSEHADLPQQLQLWDNGAGADRMQDDGIYSREQFK